MAKRTTRRTAKRVTKRGRRLDFKTAAKARAKIETKIRAALARGPKTGEELRKRTKLDVRTQHSALSRMRRAKLVTAKGSTRATLWSLCTAKAKRR